MANGDRLFGIACGLNASAGLQKPLPPLFFLTDPERTPDPVAVAGRLPEGTGVIYRSFGAAEALAIAQALADVCRRRGLLLLVGQDAELAEACGAKGVHLPERDLGRGPELRCARPDWLLTGAAHSAAALAQAEAGLDAALLSPVFPSRSPSAGRPLGPDGFAGLVRQARLPVYPLGGVTAETAPRLIGTGAAGIAAVEGIAAAF